jgi:cell division protein ZapA
MTKPVHAVSLSILDKEYKIACSDEERITLVQSAQRLDQQMRKIRDTGKVNGTDRIAVLAALNLTHELSTESHSPLSEELSARLSQLRHKIENVLEKP